MFEVYVTMKSDPNATHTFTFKTFGTGHRFTCKAFNLPGVANVEGPYKVEANYLEPDTMAAALEALNEIIADYDFGTKVAQRHGWSK